MRTHPCYAILLFAIVSGCSADSPVPSGASHESVRPTNGHPTALSASTPGRVAADVDTVALARFLEHLPVANRESVRRLFLEGGARATRIKGDAETERLFAKVFRPSVNADRALAERKAKLWQKPVSFVAAADSVQSSTIEVYGDAAHPDVIRLASSQRTVEYLATAMRTLATMRERQGASSQHSMIATISAASRADLPAPYRAFLEGQLAHLATSTTKDRVRGERSLVFDTHSAH